MTDKTIPHLAGRKIKRAYYNGTSCILEFEDGTEMRFVPGSQIVVALVIDVNSGE